MKFFLGVTDRRWFRFHQERQPDEVNFWRPGGTQTFRAIPFGAPFLFKLHAPVNKIAGGGFFVRHSNLPLDFAWDAFGEKNGSAALGAFRESIQRYRHDTNSNPIIGCTILTTPWFWPEDLWLPVPEDWSGNIVQGKTYDSEVGPGALLWAAVAERLERSLSSALPIVAESSPAYGVGAPARYRLGQGGFRVLVTESYHRRCAMTGEKTLPVHQAAHIRPYALNGPHQPENGLCLRSDLHTLFDRGYVTITPDFRIRVSRRIREEFSNGREYYALDGRPLVQLPDLSVERPAREFVEWHNEAVFLS